MQDNQIQEQSFKIATLTDEASTVTPRLSKEDLLQQISDVDANIMELQERRKALLKNKEKILSAPNNIKVTEEMHVDNKPTIAQLAQNIYADNKARALESHKMLSTFNY